MSPRQGTLGLNPRSKKGNMKNKNLLCQNQLCQMLEIWHGAMPIGLLPCLFKLRSQFPNWLGKTLMYWAGVDTCLMKGRLTVNLVPKQTCKSNLSTETVSDQLG